MPAHEDCGCGGGVANACKERGKKPQLVYAIGRLGVSFVSQARRDSIWRIVNGSREGDLKPISNAALQELFKKQPFQAQSVIWTLSRTEVPMYAIVPGGLRAGTYAAGQGMADAEVEFASIPGVLAGQIALYDGQIVDAIIPDRRGMYSWETKRYVKALRDARKADATLTAKKIDREIERFSADLFQHPQPRSLSGRARR
jgi:hypothetical protein